MQVHAFVFEKAGPPTVMKWRIKELGDPGAGEALVRHTAIGLNYIDTYHRSGLYPVEFPSGSGLEAADDEGMGHGLGVRLGPSQINGVGVGVATGTGTGASAAAGVCTCTPGKIEGGGSDEWRPCPREPRRVDEGEGVEPT